MKKIMFVMNQMTAGGAERVVSILANNMCDNNKVSLVITFNSEIHYDLHKKINVIKLGVDSESSQITRNIEEIKLLIETFKREKPNVIISFIRNITTTIAARIVGIPVIISERNNPKYDPKSKVWRSLRGIVYPLANGIVFQTKGAQGYFSNRIKKNSCIIANPITQINEKIVTNRDKDNIIVSVGRLVEQKNHKLLIESFSKLDDKYKDYKLYIYGEGCLRKNLEAEIKALKMEKKIFLVGTEKKVINKVSRAKLFVMTSKYEGYPNVLAEAVSVGVPIVSTDCNYGPREIVRDGENGFVKGIVDRLDIIKAIEKVLEGALNEDLILKNANDIKVKLAENVITEKWELYINKIIGS